MSLQDDFYEVEEFFKKQIKLNPKDKSLKSLKKSFLRIWEAFVEEERENEKLSVVTNSVTNIVSFVMKERYGQKI